MEIKLYERIKQRREELNMSQAELAEILGYKSRSTIAKIEAGENDITQSKISAFAKALKTTPAYLMAIDDKTSKDTDIRRIERARKDMSVEDRERMMQILELSFKEFFDDEED